MTRTTILLTVILAMIFTFSISSAIYISYNRDEKLLKAQSDIRYYKYISTFDDGEGNEIPYYAVQLLVQSQCIIVEPDEADTLCKYFPNN